ncbi:MAG TPA: GvpL/GvpF family gas vesicle protein, partial [Candidatus Polarisedimenticolia bacterium]|nr:GvpL/GvpF family gas vesicle protein [Candidatus Polarisedimenticolia bacterium]
MARTMTERQPDSVVYLYGVTKPPVGNSPQVPGVDGESKIEALDCAGLICWISRVPAEDFGENLSRKLEDLDWLAAISVRHQRAVAAVADKRDVLPARLGTVFLSDASLQDDISKRKAA